MTPLEYADQILADLVTFAAAENVVLPDLRFSRFTNPETLVIPCASVINFVLTMNPPATEYNPLCVGGEVLSIDLALTRGCAWLAQDDGTDDLDAMSTAMAITDADTVFLKAFADTLTSPSDPFFTSAATAPWAVRWSVRSGLISTILRWTAGVP